LKIILDKVITLTSPKPFFVMPPILNAMLLYTNAIFLEMSDGVLDWD